MVLWRNDQYQRDSSSAKSFEAIIGSVKSDRPLPNLHRDEDYHFIKTHEVAREDYPAIYLVRDGRDALVSYAHFILDYSQGASSSSEEYYRILEDLITSTTSFGGWSANVRGWTTRRTPTVVVKFEALITSPLDELQRAMASIGYRSPQIDVDKLPSFDELHQKFPQFFRKGRVGAWREELPDNLHALFWRHHRGTMHRMGYSNDELSVPGIRQLLMGKPAHMGDTLAFGVGGNGVSAFVLGWGEPEEWGTWSVAKRALLTFAVEPNPMLPNEGRSDVSLIHSVAPRDASHFLPCRRPGN